jgi:hypothetical protein
VTKLWVSGFQIVGVWIPLVSADRDSRASSKRTVIAIRPFFVRVILTIPATRCGVGKATTLVVVQPVAKAVAFARPGYTHDLNA